MNHLHQGARCGGIGDQLPDIIQVFMSIKPVDGIARQLDEPAPFFHSESKFEVGGTGVRYSHKDTPENHAHTRIEYMEETSVARRLSILELEVFGKVVLPIFHVLEQGSEHLVGSESQTRRTCDQRQNRIFFFLTCKNQLPVYGFEDSSEYDAEPYELIHVTIVWVT
jgi:hypothetical protein